MLRTVVSRKQFMPNFKLEELLSKSGEEIRSIAQSLGLNPKSSDSQQDIAYMIIDEQAIQSAQKGAQKTEKAKRPRITESKETYYLKMHKKSSPKTGLPVKSLL